MTVTDYLVDSCVTPINTGKQKKVINVQTSISTEIAESILLKEKRRAEAKAILNHPQSAVPAFLVLLLLVGLGVYVTSLRGFQGPTWLKVMIVFCVSSTAINMAELWKTRRRLDAAIVLLEQHDSQT